MPARWWHLAELARLDSELFDPDVWSVETFWAELAGPGRTFLLAVETAVPTGLPSASSVQQGSDQVVEIDSRATLLGYAIVVVNGAEADVQTIAVAPRAQGRGIGSLLLDALIAAATEQGARHLMLEVRADNQRAADLYRSRGFEQLAVRRRYYGEVDALIMRRRLGAARIGPAGT